MDLRNSTPGDGLADLSGSPALRSRTGGDFSPSPTSAGSADSPDGQIRIQMLVDREQFLLNVEDVNRNADARMVRTQVRSGNGAPLPSWMWADGDRLVVLNRPAGTDRMVLCITVQRANGSSIDYMVDVDFNAYELIVRKGNSGARAQTPLDALPPTFQQQLEGAAQPARVSTIEVDPELLEALA
jgi:hypothetical protein